MYNVLSKVLNVNCAHWAHTLRSPDVACLLAAGRLVSPKLRHSTLRHSTTGPTIIRLHSTGLSPEPRAPQCCGRIITPSRQHSTALRRRPDQTRPDRVKYTVLSLPSVRVRSAPLYLPSTENASRRGLVHGRVYFICSGGRRTLHRHNSCCLDSRAAIQQSGRNEGRKLKNTSERYVGIYRYQ